MKFEKETICPEIAEILGAFIGDGWIQTPGTALYIAGNSVEDKEYYDKFLGPLFSKHIAKVKPRLFPYWGVYGLCAANKKAIAKALRIGCTIGKKAKTVSIPESVMESKDKEVYAGVLRGIFDADGCFFCGKNYDEYSSKWKKKYSHYQRMVLSTVSKKLADQFCELLTKLNIEFRTGFEKQGFKYNRNRSDTYRIWINKKTSIERWFKIIGTSNPRIQTRYDLHKKLGYLPSYTDIYERKAILRAIETDSAVKVTHK